MKVVAVVYYAKIYEAIPQYHIFIHFCNLLFISKTRSGDLPPKCKLVSFHF